MPEILEKQIELAKGGDAQAARLLLGRVLLPHRPTEQPNPIDLPGETLTDQGRAILLAAGSGELAPSQAAQLLTGRGSLARLIETDELDRRIAALEQGIHARALTTSSRASRESAALIVCS